MPSLLLIVAVLQTSFVSGFYYGYGSSVTPTDAKAECQALGLRLAVLETLTEYEEAKAFLLKYENLWSKSKHVYIGLERDIAAATVSFKWIDGTALTYATSGTYPWKDTGSPSTDVSKACVKLEWSELKWIDVSCTSEEDFLCEGFHLGTTSITWSSAKSACEGNGMKLASLTTQAKSEAASRYINIKRAQDGSAYEKVWYGLKCNSGSTYIHEDGSALSYGSTYNTVPWNSGDPDGCMCGRLKRYDSASDAPYKWTDKECGETFPYLCQDQFTIQSTTPTTTTTTTTTTPTPTTTTTITTTTTTSPPTTSNTEPPTTTKPWWFVEYSQDGKAIGKNGKTFEESVPPARFGIIGIAVGLGTFGVIMALICVLWTCCIRNKADFVDTEDDEEEKPKPIMFSPTSVKPHGIQYIA